jgi:hypothetical protein
MKIIIRAETNVALYAVEDDQPVSLEADRVTLGDPEWLIIGDCNINNCAVLQADTIPGDWTGGKYLFDGKAWQVNPDYVEPQPTPEPEPEP